MPNPNEQQTKVTYEDLMDDKGELSGKNPDTGNKDGKPAAKKPASSGDGGKPSGGSGPAKVKIRVGNEEIETDEASAKAIKALMGEIGNLRSQITPPKKSTPKEPDPDDYDYETGLFVEPAVALKRLRAEIKKEIMGEMRGEYTAAESKKEFWKAFYGENADLKDEKLLVEAILNSNYSKLSQMQVGEAAEELAKLAKKELLRIRGGKSDADNSNPGLEGGSTKFSTRKSTQNNDDTVLSLSEIIRKRQEARRKAQFSRE